MAASLSQPLRADARWVAKQYASAANLDARIALHRRFGANPQPWQQWVLDRLTPGAGARIFEAGCGPGGVWSGNLERLDASWQLTLSDLSPGMVAQAKWNLAAQHPRAHFAVADVQNLPWPDDYFDLVVANHMLYHVPNRDRALAELHRLLKPGGRIAVATNGRNHMAELHRLIQRFFQQNPLYRLVQRLLAPSALGNWPSQRLFAYEEAQAELARRFTQVTCHPYENQLVVTEVEPLVAYILSGAPLQLPQGWVAPLRRFVQAEMAAKGSMIIVNETALFTAQKAG
jgi:ubiquinone/menaquinone biosynthesis C-methylase UbiE